MVKSCNLMFRTSVDDTYPLVSTCDLGSVIKYGEQDEKHRQVNAINVPSLLVDIALTVISLVPWSENVCMHSTVASPAIRGFFFGC